MNDMQAKMKAIILKYGHDIYLQRRSENTKGKPVYADDIEKHTVRFSIYNNRTLPNVQQEQLEGLVNTSSRVYYFLYEVNPYEGDRIYEDDPRNEKHQSVWQIDAAVPMRGIGGQIIYWVAGCSRIRPN